MCYNMSGDDMKTEIHSYESFGTVDGPGIRFVVFFQGCPLRCAYCHNPDTWHIGQGKTVDTEDILAEILKYKAYFKNGGGVTLSGGEPLLQLDAATALLQRCKEHGLHTCVDTSGAVFDEEDADKIKQFEKLLAISDLFLLDIKHMDDERHRELTARSNRNTLAFARYLAAYHKPVWIRHVLVPGYTVSEASLWELRRFLDTLDNIEKIEILPYHTMGAVKYEKLGIAYRLKDTLPPDKAQIEMAQRILWKGRNDHG